MNQFILKSFIYGGIDGIITMFNIISGVEGAKLNYYIIFLLGIGTLFGDAISMGVGEFLSLRAVKKYTQKEKLRPKLNGVITFISFVVFGLIPLLSYLLYSKYSSNGYLNTIVSTTIALFILGSLQSRYTKEKWYIGGSIITLTGLFASFVTFNIGRLISNIQT